MVEGFKYEYIIQYNLSNGISSNWIDWVIGVILVIKKAKNSILSPYALRWFVAGVGRRPLNERMRKRKRHCPRARENENGFLYLAALLSRSLCRQLASLPDICISAWISLVLSYREWISLVERIWEYESIVEIYVRDCSQENLCAIARSFGSRWSLVKIQFSKIFTCYLFIICL